MCGKTEYLSCHHWLFRKSHSLALAYDVDNGATLCYGCHIGSIHRNGDGHFIGRFLDLMRNKIGSDSISRMEEVSRRHAVTITLEDLLETETGLKEILAMGDI